MTAKTCVDSAVPVIHVHVEMASLLQPAPRPPSDASIWRELAYLAHHWLRLHPLDRKGNKLDILTGDRCRIQGVILTCNPLQFNPLLESFLAPLSPFPFSLSRLCEHRHSDPVHGETLTRGHSRPEVTATLQLEQC